MAVTRNSRAKANRPAPAKNGPRTRSQARQLGCMQMTLPIQSKGMKTAKTGVTKPDTKTKTKKPAIVKKPAAKKPASKKEPQRKQKLSTNANAALPLSPPSQSPTAQQTTPTSSATPASPTTPVPKSAYSGTKSTASASPQTANPATPATPYHLYTASSTPSCSAN
ncbi:hypothetical protein KEM56_002050 [Ascosphaera pollenicola]|nr:hypothetical protein KEM56_002050 [Ascosphaera pollenicola]